MTFDDVEHAFASGRIGERDAWILNDFLGSVRRRTAPSSPVREVVRRLSVEAGGRASGEIATDPVVPASVSRTEQRPGMLELFRRVHRGAIENVYEAPELARCETFQQMESLVRSETQAAFAKSIRDVMKAMEPWFDRDAFVIPRDRRELRAPDDAEDATGNGIPLAILPWSDFAALHEVDEVDPLLALFRRSAERMGRHFSDAWIRTNNKTAEAERAAELLQTLRQVGFAKTMGNGFASGVLDVVNPLHILVEDVLRRHGPAVFTPEFQERLIRHHLDFSVFLATFSLACLAGIENLLVVPASKETLQTVKDWTSAVQDIRGKGFPLDCQFASEYFTVRTLDDGGAAGTPIIDFRMEAFPPAELDRIASRTVRLGCPSLGNPHRLFTLAMCRAYFQAVFPTLAASF